MSIPPPLRKLQYVLAVARELHFRKAAERLNVSQPYVSRQIKEFEADIGFDIFRRDPVALTASGQALVVRVSQMMNRLDDDFRNAVDAARAISQRYAREFTIGISPWTFPILRRQVRIVQRAKFPKIQLRFRSLTALELFDALDSRQIEAGMTFAPLGRDDLRQISLRSEYLCAVLPRTNPLARRSYFSLADLNNKPLLSADDMRTHPALHQWLLERCSAAGFRPAFVEAVASAQEAFDLVQEGVGIALLPQSICRSGFQDICSVPIRDLEPIELVLAYRGDSPPLAQRIALGIADALRSPDMARAG